MRAMNPRLAAALLLCLPAADLVLAAPPSQVVAPSLAPHSAQQPPAAADQARPAMSIIADVMINGRGPFHFLLDTGATEAVIADSTVARLGLRPDLRKLVRVQGVNARVLAPEVPVDSFTFGSLQFRRIYLPVLTGPLFEGLDGILGVQGFGGVKVSVSLLDRRCIIGPSPRRASTPASATAVRLVSRQLPMVSATIAGVQTQVIIDTGASNTLGNMALLAALEKAGALQARGAAPAVLDVTPVQRKGLIGVIAPLLVGRVAVQPPEVTFDDYQVFERWHLSRRPAMLLGMDALATLATFSIDYGRRQVEVLPRSAATLSLQRMQRPIPAL
jgi:predicted aspartyl protease